MGHIWPFVDEDQIKSYSFGRMEKKKVEKLVASYSQV
jgi:hypothetical protein